jgi:uncharacterized small protein (DUF1192 family)
MIREENDSLVASAGKLSAYAVGQPLDDLSIEELSAQIEIMHHEIERLDEARQAKEASRAMAAAFFKV